LDHLERSVTVVDKVEKPWYDVTSRIIRENRK